MLGHRRLRNPVRDLHAKGLARANWRRWQARNGTYQGQLAREVVDVGAEAQALPQDHVVAAEWHGRWFVDGSQTHLKLPLVEPQSLANLF